MASGKTGVLRYRNNWKYEVTELFEHPLEIALPGTGGQISNTNAGPPLIELKTANGKNECVAIHFGMGYKWDGPSGPTIDTPNAMRASLVHDGLYQAIREGWLDKKARKGADLEFRRLLELDGMTFWRRWLWYWCVRLFAANAARGVGGRPPSQWKRCILTVLPPVALAVFVICPLIDDILECFKWVGSMLDWILAFIP